MHRVPPKEIQGLWHSPGNDPPEATNGSHIGFWLVLCNGQPNRGDEDHGHSMEVGELGWSNPGQDCSMNHGRVGRSCDGLIHQAFVHPISHGYSVWGYILKGGLPHLLVS